MGSMHTGLEDRAADFPKLAAYFAERAAGGVGLIVTGGFSPNLAGWLKPFGGTMRFPWEVRRHRQVTGAVHAHGGRICLVQILRAGRYGYGPLQVRAEQARGADQSVRPQRALSSRRRGAADPRLRAQRATGARGRLRRRRGDGLGGLPAQPVHRAAHQPARRRLGRRRRQAHALRGGDRPPHPPGLRAGLHHRLPPVDARPGRRRAGVGRGGAAGEGHRGGGRDAHQHRHRLAHEAPRSDHRHVGAARGLRRDRGAAEAARIGAAGDDQPHQHAGRRRGHPRPRRGRHGVDGATAAGRPGMGEQGARAARGRHQYVHRLQPGLPGPRVREQDRELPGQPARLRRDRAELHADREPPAHQPWSARARRAWRRRRSPRSAGIA